MSHVVVLHTSARRVVVKTTPATHLTDVLQEACKKLNVNATQFGLKHSNKQVDLSRTFRLSGLPSGAKLELVQLSRSPSVVSVALQLPESEARGAHNSRLTDKFPSTTTLWLVLRKFEAGVAGTNVQRNLTARSSPGVDQGNAGAGRLYYECPVLQVMGRELSSFTDLQKTLSQLGFNSGSTLLRLSFRKTDTPLEEAMAEIEEYFRSIDAENEASTQSAPPQPEQQQPSILPQQQQQDSAPSEEPVRETEDSAMQDVSEATQISSTPAIGDNAQPALESNDQETAVPPTSLETASDVPVERSITVLAPSDSSTPQAARHTHNETDYVPTVDDMKRHQANLSASTRPQRLLSDAEIAAKKEAELQKLASISAVEIKIRFPDQTQVLYTFTSADTGASLYSFVRDQCLVSPDQPFHLTRSGDKAGNVVVPDSEKRLIKDLKLLNKVLVNFSWADDASVEARLARWTVKESLREQAQKIEVKEPAPTQQAAAAAAPPPARTGLGGDGDGKKKGGMPKWLKLGKK